MSPATLALVEIVRTLCVCVVAGAMLGALVFWHHRHGPDKEA